MPETVYEDPETAAAFSKGSDARIAGLPLVACPFPSSAAARAWRSGYKDVQNHWGDPQWVRGRWPVMALPRIRR